MLVGSRVVAPLDPWSSLLSRNWLLLLSAVPVYKSHGRRSPFFHAGGKGVDCFVLVSLFFGGVFVVSAAIGILGFHDLFE